MVALAFSRVQTAALEPQALKDIPLWALIILFFTSPLLEYNSTFSIFYKWLSFTKNDVSVEKHIWKLIWQTLCKRFYDRYRPINAMKYSNMFYRTHIINGKAVSYLNCSSLYADNVKFSYVIDMQVMLFLGLQNGELIDNVVQTLEIDDQNVPNGWLMQDLCKSFIKFLKDYIWRSITRLTQMMAEGFIQDKQSNTTCNSFPLASDDNLQPNAQRLWWLSHPSCCVRVRTNQLLDVNLSIIYGQGGNPNF